MSLSIIYTRASLGIQAPLVTVEAHLSRGLPGLNIVGLPETAVKESKDRVRSAIINSHFEFPAKRITINLAPADLPKDGSRFDLAIAIGILAASQQIPNENLGDYEFIGELALSGKLRGVSGILPAVMASGEQQRKLFLSEENAKEASLVEATTVLPGKHLLSICAHLMAKKALKPVSFTPRQHPQATNDLADIEGQAYAKRALEIAAAGKHNLLFYGPPGTGKTMLASRLPGILPPLSSQDTIDVACVYSLNHQAYTDWQQPPFRSPHHSASVAALVGGGSRPKPGEISLAHKGVLFMDELPEFPRLALESLRQPLESGEVHISRAHGQLSFPAEFQLIAAMNPCPCGYLNDQGNNKNRCHCTQEQIQRYRQKISGPLLDRIDMHISVNRIAPQALIKPNTQGNETSAQVQHRVIAAREKQMARQACTNAELKSKDLLAACRLSSAEEQFLEHALETLNFSARAYHRVLKVARTIADLNHSEQVTQAALAEALALRSLDRNF